MKKFSQPQIIVLLDFLFIFLLILISQKPAEIKINLPENTVLQDMLFAVAKNGHTSHILQNNSWVELDKKMRISKNLKYSSNYYIDVKCNKLCEDTPPIPINSNGEKRILITGRLYSEIANVILVACKHNSSACSNLEIDINSSGKVDLTLLKQKNPIFMDIF